MAIGRGISKGLRAVGSKMQKKQQEKKMNLDVGKKGSNQRM